MDPPSLQESIRNLETSLGSLERWLAFMTALVVLGLVLEYWHELPEAIATLKRTWSWKPLCSIAGAILITVGVSGELAVQFIASGRETTLRKVNDAVFAGLNNEAARARKDAGDAIERAGHAENRASKNEREAAQLRKVAEQERLARIRVEERVAWRRLTTQQQAKIASRLTRFSGQPVSLWYHASDVEGSMFATNIGSALQRAKWRVFAPQSFLDMTAGSGPIGSAIKPMETGVTIVSTGDEPSRTAADAIVRELLALGFDAVKSPRIEPDPRSLVWVNVEPRPEGAQGEAKLRETKLRKQHK